jgi:hypothetical protein
MCTWNCWQQSQTGPISTRFATPAPVLAEIVGVSYVTNMGMRTGISRRPLVHFGSSTERSRRRRSLTPFLAKFATPLPNGTVPIPTTKHRFFAGDARDFTTVFDLQVDLPGYAIPPHPDVPEKIVTFQLYLSADSSLAEFGTHLCEPIDDRVTRGRSRVARTVGHAVARLLSADSKLFRWLERSGFGAWSGLGSNQNWLPWSWFRTAKIAKALPNHFLAFAPNAMSYHAVDLDIPPDYSSAERPVIRGFIRAGKNTKNWISRSM